MMFRARIPQFGPRGLTGHQIVQTTNVPPTPETGNVGDVAVQFNDNGSLLFYGQKSEGGWPEPLELRGLPGTAGWSPVFVIEASESDLVWRLADWIGGGGVKPGGVGMYVGPDGLVEEKANAVRYGLHATAMAVLFDNASADLPGAPTSVQAAIEALAGQVSYGVINLLINGDMGINQRAFAGGALSAGIYGRDRWKAGGGGCNVSVASGVITHTSGPLVQIVESPGLADVTVTLSVEDLTGGDLDVDIEGETGTITAGSGRRGVTLTVPGASTGNVTVTLTPASGAVTYRRIQLNVGSVALPWERRHPVDEMALCQRYYALMMTVSGYLRGSTANNREADLAWPVRMRATPTVTGIASAGTFSVVLNSAMGAQLRSAVGNTTSSVNFSDVVADAEL